MSLFMIAAWPTVVGCLAVFCTVAGELRGAF